MGDFNSKKFGNNENKTHLLSVLSSIKRMKDLHKKDGKNIYDELQYRIKLHCLPLVKKRSL